jgi:hypothetical protein
VIIHTTFLGVPDPFRDCLEGPLPFAQRLEGGWRENNGSWAAILRDDERFVRIAELLKQLRRASFELAQWDDALCDIDVAH